MDRNSSVPGTAVLASQSGRGLVMKTAWWPSTSERELTPGCAINGRTCCALGNSEDILTTPPTLCEKISYNNKFLAATLRQLPCENRLRDSPRSYVLRRPCESWTVDKGHLG